MDVVLWWNIYRQVCAMCAPLHVCRARSCRPVPVSLLVPGFPFV